MAFKKAVPLGICLALAAGLLLASVMPANGASAAQVLDSSPMTIPVGHVGDEVTYAAFERNGSHEEWQRRDPWAFKVAQLSSAKDSALVEHPAIRVLDSRNQNSKVEVYATVVAGDSSWTTESGQSVFVDLDGGAVVRYEGGYSARDVTAGALTQSADVVVSALGPFLMRWSSRDAGPAGWGHERFLPLAFQDRTYELAQEIPDVGSVVILQHASFYDRSVLAANWSQTSVVAGRQLIEGVDAYDLRTEGCFDVARVPGASPSDLETEEGVPFLNTMAPIGARLCFRVDIWVSAARPYPILLQESTTVDGQTRERLEVLAKVREGNDGPIPWEPSRPVSYLSSVAGVERSGVAVRYPVEGSNSRLAYRMSDALAAIAADPSLGSFSSWKGQHPDAVMIGYRLYPTHDSLYWTFVYGTEKGEGFAVESQKRNGAPIATNRAIGAMPIEKFKLDDLPRNQVTLAAVEDMYARVYKDDPASKPPTTIYWGPQYLNVRLDCFVPTNCAVSAQCLAGAANKSDCLPYTGMKGGRDRWDWLNIGRYPERASAPAHVSGQHEGAVSYQWLIISPAEGFIWNHGLTRQDWIDVTPATVTGVGPPKTSTSAAAGGTHVSIPDLSTAVLISTSLAAAFLAAYFWPVIRYVGTSGTGMVGAVFGYAKLRRSDLLEKKVRDDLVSAIRRDPGVSTSDLAQSLASGWSTIVYHLRVLEKNNLISSLVDGRHKRFFPTDDVDFSKRERLAVLRNLRTKQMYETILEEPGVIQGELAARAGISMPAVYWHVRRLEGAGLVGHDKLGRRVHYYPAESSSASTVRRDESIEVV